MKMTDGNGNILNFLMERLRQLSKQNGITVIVTMIGGTIDKYLENIISQKFDRTLNINSDFNPFDTTNQNQSGNH